MAKIDSSLSRVTSVTKMSHTKDHGGGTQHATPRHRFVRYRNVQASDMKFSDILGKETEKLCQLEK